MRARDLFAGSGWSVACRALGIEDHGVEWNEHARETRRINGLITVGSDVRDVNGADGEYTLEIGSPPCERFTSAGHGDGHRARAEIVETVLAMQDPGDIYAVIKSLDEHHEKIGLVLEPFRVLLENPHARAAVWEQVPTVLPIWEAVARKLTAWGWSVDTRNVNASWYGVPQDRKRAILLARRDGEAKIPGEIRRRTMRDVFPDRDGWIQRSNYSAPATRDKRTAQERGRTMRTLDQVSVTMTRKAAQWIRPDGSVTRMTVADMAAVQTFPEDMIFAGGMDDQRLQIGNAVPPLMAEVLIRAALGLTLNSHGGKVGPDSNDEPEGDEMTAMTATTTETAPATKHTGSAVVQLLERVWDRIRENHPELPQAVIVTGMGADITGLKWGHFRADGWEVVQAEGAALRMNEMFMAGETLAKGALQVLQTMLHEGAHTLARVREIQDTSRQHRWHNAKFRALAEEMGLEYTPSKADPKIGFSAVTLTEETKAEYADLIAELDKEISLVISLPGWLGGLGGLLGGLGGDPLGGDGIKGRPAEPTTNTSSNVKLTCECAEPTIIRASKKVAAKMVVRCDECGELFLER